MFAVLPVFFKSSGVPSQPALVLSVTDRDCLILFFIYRGGFTASKAESVLRSVVPAVFGLLPCEEVESCDA